MPQEEEPCKKDTIKTRQNKRKKCGKVESSEDIIKKMKISDRNKKGVKQNGGSLLDENSLNF